MEDCEDVYLKVSEAIQSKNHLTIIYHGGSNPGMIREVFPFSIEGEMLQARCGITNNVKMYNLRKMQVVDEHGVVVGNAISENKNDFSCFASLEDFFDDQRDALEALGWGASFSENRIELRRFFKNGKPRKTPDLYLAYEEYIFEYYYDEEMEVVTTKKTRERPWIVSIKNKVSVFSHKEKAMDKFFAAACEHAPAKQ